MLLDAKVPVFSFIFGVPPREILDECRAKNIVIAGAATTAAEALALHDAQVDFIVASGFEAGGHRGSFLRPAEQSLNGTFSLVPRIVDLVDVPVVAAGGIADDRGIVAALALGAEGVQLGTVFLHCEESGSSPLHRAELRSDRAGNTALTKGFTGRFARGIQNQLMDELNQPDADVLPYPLQRAMVKSLSAPAEKAGHAEFVPMWAGQSATLSHESNVTALLQTLVAEAAPIAEHVLQWRSQTAKSLQIPNAK